MEEKQEVITQMAEMTAGEMLRNARTTGRRKREIATIAKLLCIKEEFLTALEEGNYRVIPEDVYILGFARSYAVELGLNPDDVILQLKRELGLIKDEKKEKDEEPEKIIPVVQKEEINTINTEKIIAFVKTSVQYVKKNWVWFLSGFVALLVAVILTIVLLTGNNTTADEHATQQVVTENVADNAEKAVVDPEFRYPVREKFDVKNRKESRVVLQAEKESWIKIEDARGGTVFSRVLVPGDVYYMPLGDKFKGTFGNAGAVDVWVDGRLINKVGPANTRKNGVSMAPDALKALGFAE